MEHVYQVMRDGWWTFYIKYLWWLSRYGYEQHPYEQEARGMEHSPLSHTERRFKDD